jgi:hypothetical protein
MHSGMKKFVLAAFLGALACAGTAHAQRGYPDEYALRPLQLPTEMAQLKVPLVINLSKDNVGNPIFIPFDIRFGLSSELELDIFHPERGLCVSGQSKGCGHVYNDIAVGLLYSVMREREMDLSLFGAFEVAQFASPAHLRLDAGVAFKFVQPQWSIFAKPYIGIGMNHRDENGDAFKMPIEFAFQLSRPTALFIETGFYGDLHNLGDTWSSPVGVGINFLLQHGIDMGAEFKLDDLIGNGSTTDSRSFIFYFAFRN